MVKTSDSIKSLSTALLAFHKEIGTVYKSETNPFFKSKYADLSTILSAIQKPLENSKLVITQHPTDENTLATLMVHTESGEYILSSYKMTPAKNDPQGQGSLITYARRYALGAILSLNIDVDDDGNFASAVTKKPSSPAVSPKKEEVKINNDDNSDDIPF